MTTNYRIICASSHLDLQDKVQFLIDGGHWQPQGGVTVMGYGPGAPEYLQAMVADASQPLREGHGHE